MSPSSAFANWLSGTSTFLLMPVMSVNCSRRKSTPNFLVSLSISSRAAPLVLITSPRSDGFSAAGTVMGLRVGKEASGEKRGQGSGARGQGVKNLIPDTWPLVTQRIQQIPQPLRVSREFAEPLLELPLAP